MDSLIERTFIDRFGGKLFYAMPDGRHIYHYRGKDYLLDAAIADPESVMATGLEEGKNLLIQTFPAVDLYPDSNAVY